MSKFFDYMIIGAGFTGIVLAERIATQLNKKVLLVDKRDHIGGNAYDYYETNGILIHKYGPHIFHTNSLKVSNYLSKFTLWRDYDHKVLAAIDNKKVPLPFNLNTIHKLFPEKVAIKLETSLIKNYGYDAKIPILKLLKSTSIELKNLATFIYEKVFYGYTMKQWDLKPEELDPSVTARVPVYISNDDRYFQDSFQKMPKDGYTKMFENMIKDKNIDVILNKNYTEMINVVKFNKLIFTGPIDEFFDYKFGYLPYRSLNFIQECLEQEYYQEVGTVNYPNDFDYTRITESKYLTGQSSNNTIITYEYPTGYNAKLNQIPYYPIPTKDNYILYKKYFAESKKIKNVIFAGRLGDYKYYNMDQAVGRALTIFEKECY